MIVVTTEEVTGYEIAEVKGLVKGSTIQTRHIGRDITSGLKSLVGGEIRAYSEMMEEARELALSRLIEDAEKKGANAVIGVRLSTTSVMNTAAEIIIYGTAVVLQQK